jgi:putative membrane protein
MNRTKFSLLILCIAAALSAPGVLAQVDPQSDPRSPNPQPNPARPIPDATGVPGDSAHEMQDKAFLRKAAEGGLAEIQLGKLATERASADDVKAFGQKMVDDHTRLNESMVPIAQSKGVVLPRKMNKADQAEYEKLGTLSGEDFDKEYIAYMVKDHHTDLRDFRAESVSTNDPDLKAAVDKAAFVIRDHMILADKLAREKGIQSPGRGGKPSGMTGG